MTTADRPDRAEMTIPDDLRNIRILVGHLYPVETGITEQAALPDSEFRYDDQRKERQGHGRGAGRAAHLCGHSFEFAVCGVDFLGRTVAHDASDGQGQYFGFACPTDGDASFAFDHRVDRSGEFLVRTPDGDDIVRIVRDGTGEGSRA